MKNFLLFLFVLVFGLSMSADISGSPQQAQAQGRDFTCFAESANGTSFYTHSSRTIAARRAVQICQANTWVGDYCWFVGCTPY